MPEMTIAGDRLPNCYRCGKSPCECAASKGIGGHTKAFRGTSDDWITPKAIVDALGPFDLDPCACTPQPWPCATRSYTIHDNGLIQPWFGRVWLNPPYGPRAAPFLEKMVEHGNGIALMFARTETAMFHKHVWPFADGLLFLEGRLHFCHPDGRRAKGNSGGPSVLIAFGHRNVQALMCPELDGAFVVPSDSQAIAAERLRQEVMF